MRKTRKTPDKPVPSWSALRRAGEGTIEAYIETSRAWEPIVEITAIGLVAKDRRATASLIIDALDRYQRNRVLIPHMIAALELCLECEGLSWAAEHDAEIVLKRAKALCR